MRVNELMTRDVARVRAQDTLARVVELMEERDCGCVAVTDERATIVGVLTDRDVSLAALRADGPLSKLKANDFMRTEVVTCAPGDSIGEAERRMGQHQVRRLPVIDARGSLCGILSLDDIAKEACREEGWIGPPVSMGAVGRTLGQIGRPRLVGGEE